jgi:spermidine synthase
MRRHAVLCLVFFLSGLSALVFESLWFRLAGLTLGNSVHSSSVVLGSFMGGLALGNWIAARWGSRSARPFQLYALLELAIGVIGVGVVLLLPALSRGLAPLLRATTDSAWQLHGLRGAVAFGLLLLPAASMGLTLPLLVKGLCDGGADFGRSLGLLYGCNTLGAVCGALSTELLLVPALGLTSTALVAGGLNASVALIVWRGFRGLPAGEAPEAGATAARPLGREGVRLLGAAFLVGGALLALEVVWFRFMLLFTMGTSVIFAVMLAVVLAGIGVGGLLGASGAVRRAAEGRESAVALLAGVWVVAGLWWFASPSGGFSGRASTSLPVVLGRALVLMFPTSVVSGLLFPLLGQRLQVVVTDETRAAGLLTLANTLGATAGALGGGFALVPGLGMERSLLALTLVYGAAGLLLLPARRGAPASGRLVLAGGAGLFVAALACFPFGGLQRLYVKVVEPYLQGDRQIVAVREGLTETAIYLRGLRLGETYAHGLITNGHSMAGTENKVRKYMKFFVYLPVALHPRPRKALLICFGAGSTAKALVDTQSLEQIDVVDISRNVLEMSSVVYPDPSEHPLRDPRVRVRVEDGRFFLQTSDERYDLITGEPPPLKAQGVVNLYTREFFQLVHDRLAPGGMTSYWLPIRQVGERDRRAVIRAFTDVFEESSLWMGSGDEWMLFGVRGPAERVDAERFSAQWRDPRVAGELVALGFEDPALLGAYFLADGDTLRELVRDVPPLVDEFPHRLNPIPPRAFTHADHPQLVDPELNRERFRASAHVARLWPSEMREATLNAFDAFHHLHDVCAPPGHRLGPARPVLEDLHWVLTHTALVTLAQQRMFTDPDEQQIVRRVYEAGRRDAVVLTKLGDAALASRDYPRAVEWFERAVAIGPGGPTYRLLYALCLEGDLERAREVAQTAPPHPDGVRVRAFFTTTFGLELPPGDD